MRRKNFYEHRRSSCFLLLSPAFSSCLLLLPCRLNAKMRLSLALLLWFVGLSVGQVLDDRYKLDESLAEAGEIVVWPEKKTEKKTETTDGEEEEEDGPPTGDDGRPKKAIVIASNIEETATAVAQWLSVAIFLVGLVAGLVRVVQKLRENPGEFLEILQDFRLSLARHAANARNRIHR